MLQPAFFVWCLVLLATGTFAEDAASIKYKVNPMPQAKPGSLHPTCRPTVTSAHSAFMCFADEKGQNHVQYVDPTNPTTSYAKDSVKTPPAGIFRQSPIPLSRYAAIVDSANQEYSYWTMASPKQLFHEHDRKNSTASVAYNPDDKIAYIPFGRTHMSVADSISAIDVTSVKDTVLWQAKFPFPKGFQGTSLMGTPIYYDGAVFLMQQNTFYKLNATKAPDGKSQILLQISDPCGIKPAAGAQVELEVVTFSQDHNGNLDAFVLVANTTVGNKKETTICRISHHSGHSEWPEALTYPRDIDIHDVSAGNNIILISARVLGVAYEDSHVILGINAHNGSHVFTVHREPQDRLSFPLTLQQEVEGCKGLGTFVAQKNGKLTAFCSANAKQQWTSARGCSAKPTPVQMADDHVTFVEDVACIELDESVNLIDSRTGDVVWSNKIEAIYAPTFVDGFVWTVDTNGWLYGMVPLKTPANGPKSTHQDHDHGLSAGTIVLILFVCAFVIGLGVGLAFSWAKRSKRRSGYQAELDENGYGSLSS